MGEVIDETEQVSALIGDIYDAALDRSLWPAVLEKTCHFARGRAAALVAQGPTRSEAEIFFEWGLDPDFLESYHHTYGILNPMHIPVLIHAEAGSIHAATDLVPVDELIASRFYKEWLAPQETIDAIAAIFEKSATSYAMLTIHRHERDGTVDDEARRRMRLIAPHFQRAVGIGKLIDLQRFEVAALADSLDGLAAAMVLVDGNGRIMHANKAAEMMLAEGIVLRAVGGTLASSDAPAERTLREIFMNAATGAGADSAMGVPLKGPDDRWIAHVLPLTSGTRRKAGINYSAVAAVFVRKAALELPHPLETIARAYQLTTMEMRVLMAVVQIGGVPEIAPVLGIAETTVRTHLQSVFEKTGAKRQADLVKLVASYMSPLRP